MERLRIKKHNKALERAEKKKQKELTSMRTSGTMEDRDKARALMKTTRNIRSIDPPGQTLRKSATAEHLSITLKKRDHKLRALSRSMSMSRGMSGAGMSDYIASSSRANLVEVGSNYYIDIPFNTDANADLDAIGDMLGPDSAGAAVGSGLEALDSTNQDDT